MSSVVIYSDAVRDLGLKFALRNSEQLDLDIRVTSTSQKAHVELYTPRRETTVDLIKQKADGILESIVLWGRSATFFLTEPGAPVSEDELRPRANFQFFSDFPDHVTVVAGRPPGDPIPATGNGEAPTIEVWMGVEAAEFLAVSVGDIFDLHPFWREDVAPVKAIVVGFVQANDPEERYFFGESSRLGPSETRWPTYVFFTTERVVVEILGGYLPGMDASFDTYGFIDPSALNSRNAAFYEAEFVALGIELEQALLHTRLNTTLPEVIDNYQERLFFTRLPLFALMFLMVGIALYYLVIVATMVVERQAGEIALLKSRGASVSQIMTVYFVEGLGITIAASILGPLLAVFSIRFLGPTPPFRELSGGELLDTTLSIGAFGMAVLGALLALGATLWPAYRSAGKSIVHFKQSAARPDQQPVFLRYYLDLGLLGIGAFAFYQLRQRGSVVTESLFGDLSADPLLLISPGLFMVMIALVFLRLFPLALGVLAWAVKGSRGATIPLALWRMVRSPLHYSRLILLLILATAVGMFAAGFGATLERSYEDRASYRAGAEARVSDLREVSAVSNDEFAAIFDDLPGIDNVRSTARVDGSYDPRPFQTTRFDVLGVGVGDEGLDGVAYWRDDFAESTFQELMDNLVPEVPFETAEGLAFPAGTTFVGFWGQATLNLRLGRPELRLQDTNGVFWHYRFLPSGVLVDGWRFFVTRLSTPLPVSGTVGDLPRGELIFDSMYLRVSGLPGLPVAHSFHIDDLQYILAASVPDDWENLGFGSEGVVLEPFESLDRYELINGVSPVVDQGSLSLLPVNNARGQNVARFAFTYAPGISPVIGMRLISPPDPIPVAVSESFLEATGDLSVGDQLVMRINSQLVDVVIVAQFANFPGFYPSQNSHLILADIETLQVAAARVPSMAAGIYANEAWIGVRGDEPVSVEWLSAQGLTARTVLDRDLIDSLQSRDPLVGASWEGILFLSFATVLILTALGFVVFSYLAAQTRSLEFAILRTMGFSGRQILGVVAFEQIVVIISGVAAGTLLGFPLGRLLISSLGLTDDGAEVVPSLVSEISWTTVFTVYALLAIVFVATVSTLVRLYSRLALHRTLRIGEV